MITVLIYKNVYYIGTYIINESEKNQTSFERGDVRICISPAESVSALEADTGTETVV